MDPDCAITAGRAQCLKEKTDKKLKRKDTLFMSWEEKKRKGVKTANGQIQGKIIKSSAVQRKLNDITSPWRTIDCSFPIHLH